MSIKIAFSSMSCPAWDLKTMVQQAKAIGYDGLELRGLSGKFHLPEVPELADDPDAARRLLRDAGISLVCLGSSASFESRDRKVLTRSRRDLSETIELAGKLACPHVRIFLGNVTGSEYRGTLSRVAAELRDLAPLATRHGTTILAENGGDFLASEDLWFLLDAVGHPGVQACWNPLNALTRGERPTLSIPRLGRRIALFRLTDGVVDERMRFAGYRITGEGQVGFDRAIELLKGIRYQGWLSFEWPKMLTSVPEPEEALPKILAFTRARLAEKQPILTAYKGDKNAPKFRPAAKTETAPAT